MVYYFFLKQWSRNKDKMSSNEYDLIYPSNDFLGRIGKVIKVNNKLYIIVDYAEEVVE